MAAKTFGKRGTGSAMTVSYAPPIPAPAGEPEAAGQADARALPKERDLFDAMPLLTFGLIIFLIMVFGLQLRFAFGVDAAGEVGLRSLLAEGAASRDLVLGQGEVWRVFLAPLLHGGNSHLVGNCIALFFVGIRLEPMVGRSWLAFIFAASALGGEIGSLTGNPPEIPGVGASGAISGLIGALFTLSFHPRVPQEERWPMLRTSLIFGGPALLPLLWAHSGNTDYYAHGAGALTGVLIAFAVAESDEMRAAGKHALKASLAALGLSVLACGFAAAGYGGMALEARDFIPASEMPKNLQANARESMLLIQRYPKDPESHIIRAIYLADHEHAMMEAEREVQAALKLAPAGPMGLRARMIGRFLKIVIVAQQGRTREARAMAEEFCTGKANPELRQAAEGADLCENGTGKRNRLTRPDRR